MITLKRNYETRRQKRIDCIYIINHIYNDSNRMKTEQQIQTKIKNKLQERGWFVTKLIKTSTNGIPDLLAIKYGKAMFIEVKRENGKLKPLQQELIRQLSESGAIVKVWSDFEVDFK